MANKKLEIACFNLESALIAQENGADRVELCAEMHLGGTTPNFETIKRAKENLSIDVYVMIRPRGGNFVYSGDELEQMKKSILKIKKLNVNGFVFGILNEDNSVNNEQNTELVNLAKPVPCTFHRAFNEVDNYKSALEDVISCGFTTVLTSGTFPNVMEGKEVLQELVIQANNRITIMPGGGLRSKNILKLDELVNAEFYHSSAITDCGETANSNEIIHLKKNISNS